MKQDTLTMQKCEALLKKRDSKKIGNNTYLHRVENGYAVRLHNTDVVIVTREGWILNSGGWETVTTKARINQYAPVYVSQTNFIWSVNYFGHVEKFYDGMIVSVDHAFEAAL